MVLRRPSRVNRKISSSQRLLRFFLGLFFCCSRSSWLNSFLVIGYVHQSCSRAPAGSGGCEPFSSSALNALRNAPGAALFWRQVTWREISGQSLKSRGLRSLKRRTLTDLILTLIPRFTNVRVQQVRAAHVESSWAPDNRKLKNTYAPKERPYAEMSYALFGPLAIAMVLIGAAISATAQGTSTPGPFCSVETIAGDWAFSSAGEIPTGLEFAGVGTFHLEKDGSSSAHGWRNVGGVFLSSFLRRAQPQWNQTVLLRKLLRVHHLQRNASFSPIVARCGAFTKLRNSPPRLLRELAVNQTQVEISRAARISTGKCAKTGPFSLSNLRQSYTNVVRLRSSSQDTATIPENW